MFIVVALTLFLNTKIVNFKLCKFNVFQVVFIGESGGYIPIPAIRNQPPPVDDVDWQHPLDTWDREYRRFRFNNTKVQRKFRNI